MKKLFLPNKIKSLIGDLVVFVSVSAVFILVVLLGLDAEMNRVIQYNCEISEISPDFTPAMKQECRKLRKLKQQEQRYYKT